MIVANPIYDIVFKYLMEDERIARTILSALLKKDIVKVEIRPHEYANVQRDAISVFRIDFGATVREADGKEHLILIELQKTWLETETLRFRQYLGVQYQSKNNMVGNSKDAHALPMVAVYLLGHKVGDIEEPVLYVQHQSYDYNGNVVTKGLPNPFVDSLTHNSIIVQIPRLHGQINNRLDKVLSIFDQTRINKNNSQVLMLDDHLYDNDEEMKPILHRLLMAASDADMRMDMNVEDEYYSVIESRDTEIMIKLKKIAEQRARIKEKDARIREKDAQLEEKDEQLEEKDAQLEEKDAQIEEKDAQLEEKDAMLKEKDIQMEEVVRNSILALHRSGLTVWQIAKSLGVDVEVVKSVVK
ncbi:MAG: hypothetical protein IJK87_07700 [Prevotella sp.]|nr:hypothetical protein [Prevotella sp.]